MTKLPLTIPKIPSLTKISNITSNYTEITKLPLFSPKITKMPFFFNLTTFPSNPTLKPQPTLHPHCRSLPTTYPSPNHPKNLTFGLCSAVEVRKSAARRGRGGTHKSSSETRSTGRCKSGGEPDPHGCSSNMGREKGDSRRSRSACDRCARREVIDDCSLVVSGSGAP